MFDRYPKPWSEMQVDDMAIWRQISNNCYCSYEKCRSDSRPWLHFLSHSFSNNVMSSFIQKPRKNVESAEEEHSVCIFMSDSRRENRLVSSGASVVEKKVVWCFLTVISYRPFYFLFKVAAQRPSNADAEAERSTNTTSQQTRRAETRVSH